MHCDSANGHKIYIACCVGKNIVLVVAHRNVRFSGQAVAGYSGSARDEHFLLIINFLYFSYKID